MGKEKTMRKLLVLVAVFAMSPIVSGMTVTISNTETQVQLYVVDATYDPFLAMVIETPGVLINFAANTLAPSLNSSYGAVIIDGDNGEAWGFGIEEGESYQDGVWLFADWSTTSFVNAYAYETFDGGYTWTLLDQIQVPEPMTLALLGLGGLFILRHRK
jgi:hypothetical protein